MIRRVPALYKILQWAERQKGHIIFEKLRQSAGKGLNSFDRYGPPADHMAAADATVCGCVSNCAAGEAKLLFKQAGRLEGIQAWRRIARLIENGSDGKCKQLRREVRMARSHHIRSLVHVTMRIAKYENKIRDYVDAGCRQPPEDELKSDLNAILPNELGDYVAVRCTDPRHLYNSFETS